MFTKQVWQVSIIIFFRPELQIFFMLETTCQLMLSKNKKQIKKLLVLIRTETFANGLIQVPHKMCVLSELVSSTVAKLNE